MGVTVRRNVFFFFLTRLWCLADQIILKKKKHMCLTDLQRYRSERLFVAEKICKSIIRIIEGEVVSRENKIVYET